jgi:hypothetical protein
MEATILQTHQSVIAIMWLLILSSNGTFRHVQDGQVQNFLHLNTWNRLFKRSCALSWTALTAFLEESRNPLVSTPNEFSISTMGDTLGDARLSAGLERRQYGEDSGISMPWSAAGLDRKLRAHLEKLDTKSAFCSRAGSPALLDLEKDFTVGDSCCLCAKLDDLIKPLSPSLLGDPVERRREPVSDGVEAFGPLVRSRRPEKLEDRKRDFEKMLGPSASESCRDEMGTTSSFFVTTLASGSKRLGMWSGAVEGLGLQSRWRFLSDSRSMDENVRDLEKCLEFALGFGGRTGFKGGVVCRENNVLGDEGCWGL